MFLKFLFFVFIQMHFVFTCDEPEVGVTDTSAVSGEYSNIFEIIPTLFEYVMNVIEEKPEILEKDDVTIFTRDSGIKDLSEDIQDGGDSTSLQSLDSFEDGDDDIYDFEDLEFDFWDWYIGAVDGMRLTLTSAEVAEKVLEIEQKLEEYNNVKKNT